MGSGVAAAVAKDGADHDDGPPSRGPDPHPVSPGSEGYLLCHRFGGRKLCDDPGTEALRIRASLAAACATQQRPPALHCPGRQMLPAPRQLKLKNQNQA